MIQIGQKHTKFEYELIFKYEPLYIEKTEDECCVKTQIWGIDFVVYTGSTFSNRVENLKDEYKRKFKNDLNKKLYLELQQWIKQIILDYAKSDIKRLETLIDIIYEENKYYED